MIPKSLTFIVRGIFSTGMYEFDSSMVYISLPAAEKLFMVDMPSGIEIKVADIYAAGTISQEIVKQLEDGYWAKTWKDMNKSLFSALKLEKTIMFIILLFIILVAAFSIISTLIMLVMEKRKEIAILKSMGATMEQILRIFMTMGMAIGITGSLVGLVLGLLLTHNLNAVVAGSGVCVQDRGDAERRILYHGSSHQDGRRRGAPDHPRIARALFPCHHLSRPPGGKTGPRGDHPL